MARTNTKPKKVNKVTKSTPQETSQQGLQDVGTYLFGEDYGQEIVPELTEEAQPRMSVTQGLHYANLQVTNLKQLTVQLVQAVSLYLPADVVIPEFDIKEDDVLDTVYSDMSLALVKLGDDVGKVANVLATLQHNVH